MNDAIVNIDLPRTYARNMIFVICFPLVTQGSCRDRFFNHQYGDKEHVYRLGSRDLAVFFLISGNSKANLMIRL